MGESFELRGNIVDVTAGDIFPGRVLVADGKIAEVEATPEARYSTLICPGLIDAHVHVESSLLTPAEFGRAAFVHGTVASVSDPHEIANVLGVAGVEWMLEDARRSPFQVYFGAPSCVPATPFETAGAALGPEEIGQLLDREEIRYLAEVMNFPGVIQQDPKMMAIIAEAKARGKRIDGHAPAVTGEDIKRYVAAGIETDHESITLEEARQKCQLGMKIALREGSAARNFDALWPLSHAFPSQCFFCSDDKHPDELILSHINAMVARAIHFGVEPMIAFRAATLNPALHYGLPSGLLRVGDRADIAEFDNIEGMQCLRCWAGGQLVAEKGQSLLAYEKPSAVNYFKTHAKRAEDFTLPPCKGERRVIVALDGEIFTEATITQASGPDTERDLLLIAVVNRYADTPPAVGLVSGFGLKDGAMASSVAHDSHNIVAVGTNAHDLCRAVNLVIAAQGGLSICAGKGGRVLALPVAGLMSDGECHDVADSFLALTRAARGLGCGLASPFMTLSFMALPVIPRLKITDKGLFDVETFQLVG